MKHFFKTHRHILWALYFVVYLAGVFLVERIVPTEGYHVMYHPLDDRIPFCEYFIVFYYIWYLFIGGTALYLIFADAPAFRRYMWFFMISFSFTLIFNVTYPNGQDLRPDLSALGRDNLFIRLIEMIYAADTNTNVCPSMHVIGSFAAMFAVFDCKRLRKTVVAPILAVLLTILVSASTVLVKQHSIVDVFWGVIASAVVFVIVYGLLRKKADLLEIKKEKSLI